MISVVIPTLDDEATLPDMLSALVSASVDGLVREVIIADAGSKDATREIADCAGAEVVAAGSGRGLQLAAGAARARRPWLLFLNPDTVLDQGWEREASRFIEKIEKDPTKQAAAAFGLALDDEGFAPRFLESLARLRFALLRIPYSAQGLLIPRRLYDSVGGHRALATGEDVDLARRVGRSRIKLLRARAVASARRYRRDGYLRRGLSDQLDLVRYAFGAPVTQTRELRGERTDP